MFWLQVMQWCKLWGEVSPSISTLDFRTVSLTQLLQNMALRSLIWYHYTWFYLQKSIGCPCIFLEPVSSESASRTWWFLQGKISRLGCPSSMSTSALWMPSLTDFNGFLMFCLRPVLKGFPILFKAFVGVSYPCLRPLLRDSYPCLSPCLRDSFPL